MRQGRGPQGGPWGPGGWRREQAQQQWQRFLEEELYPMIGDARYKEGGKLKRHWDDFSDEHMRSVYRLMQMRGLSKEAAEAQVRKWEREQAQAKVRAGQPSPKLSGQALAEVAEWRRAHPNATANDYMGWVGKRHPGWNKDSARHAFDITAAALNQRQPGVVERATGFARDMVGLQPPPEQPPTKAGRVQTRMDPRDAARAGGDVSAWDIAKQTPQAVWHEMVYDPLAAGAERYGYTAGLHDAGAASDWDLIRDGALFGGQLALTAADVGGAAKIPKEAAKQGVLKPFNRYWRRGKSPTGPWLTRGVGAPYGDDMVRAQRMLSLEHTPTNVTDDVPVPFWEPVAGPRPARPQYGQPGGGMEYLRGRQQAVEKLREGDVVGAVRSLSLPKVPMTREQKKEFAEYLAAKGIQEPDNWAVIATLLPSLPEQEREEFLEELRAASASGPVYD